MNTERSMWVLAGLQYGLDYEWPVVCLTGPQWFFEPSGGAKIGKLKFEFLAGLLVLGY